MNEIGTLKHLNRYMEQRVREVEVQNEDLIKRVLQKTFPNKQKTVPTKQANRKCNSRNRSSSRTPSSRD